MVYLNLDFFFVLTIIRGEYDFISTKAKLGK